MSFVERELGKLTKQMLGNAPGSPEWREHYAAQQALAWALDPNAFRSPSNLLSGRPAEDDVLESLPGARLSPLSIREPEPA